MYMYASVHHTCTYNYIYYNRSGIIIACNVIVVAWLLFQTIPQNYNWLYILYVCILKYMTSLYCMFGKWVNTLTPEFIKKCWFGPQNPNFCGIYAKLNSNTWLLWFQLYTNYKLFLLYNCSSATYSCLFNCSSLTLWFFDLMNVIFWWHMVGTCTV